jgi:hypothetical protein
VGGWYNEYRPHTVVVKALTLGRKGLFVMDDAYTHTSAAGSEWEYSNPHPKIQFWAMNGPEDPVGVMVIYSQKKKGWTWNVSLSPLIEPETMKGVIPFNVVVSGFEKDAEAAMDRAEAQYSFVQRTGELGSLVSKWKSREAVIRR